MSDGSLDEMVGLSSDCARAHSRVRLRMPDVTPHLRRMWGRSGCTEQPHIRRRCGVPSRAQSDRLSWPHVTSRHGIIMTQDVALMT